MELVRFRNRRGSLSEAVECVDGEGYRSRFQNWDNRASVRRKPHRQLEAPPLGLYFPPELTPVVGHPLVAERSEEIVKRLLVHRLFGYLHFTTELEQVAVIPVTQHISRKRIGLDLPEGMIEDAYKITTDEAWHAQFSYELIRQVQQATGVRPWLPETPEFLARLGRINRTVPAELRGADQLMFSVVSETLISSLLSGIPRDQRLPAAVRELVGDHAEDEGKHHAYFRHLLTFVWPALSKDQRRKIGPLIPEFIYAFLEPDYRALGYALHACGFEVPKIEAILADTYPAEVVRHHVRSSACATVQYFTAVGALDDVGTADAFREAGLVD